MTRVLLTAFEPYDRWTSNASGLALDELEREMPPRPQVTLRRYPVDFDQIGPMLAADLAAGYDFALHVGQAPAAATIRLEAIAINVCGRPDRRPETIEPLCPQGPVAYRTALPLGHWAARLREAGLPAEVSWHAGTFLCNAALYWTHHLAQQHGWATRAAFVHVPLESSQVPAGDPSPSMPAARAAEALRLLLKEMVALGPAA